MKRYGFQEEGGKFRQDRAIMFGFKAEVPSELNFEE